MKTEIEVKFDTENDFNDYYSTPKENYKEIFKLKKNA